MPWAATEELSRAILAAAAVDNGVGFVVTTLVVVVAEHRRYACQWIGMRVLSKLVFNGIECIPGVIIDSGNTLFFLFFLALMLVTAVLG